MKPRARRVTIAAAALGAGVIGALMVVPGPLRDHLSAWYFQLTTETETIEPAHQSKSFVTRELQAMGRVEEDLKSQAESQAHVFLSLLGAPAIATVEDLSKMVRWLPVDAKLQGPLDSLSQLARRILEANGWRVIEQRLPRRAYVVIWDEGTAR